MGKLKDNIEIIQQDDQDNTLKQKIETLDKTSKLIQQENKTPKNQNDITRGLNSFKELSNLNSGNINKLLAEIKAIAGNVSVSDTVEFTTPGTNLPSENGIVKLADKTLLALSLLIDKIIARYDSGADLNNSTNQSIISLIIQLAEKLKILTNGQVKLPPSELNTKFLSSLTALSEKIAHKTNTPGLQQLAAIQVTLAPLALRISDPVEFFVKRVAETKEQLKPASETFPLSDSDRLDKFINLYDALTDARKYALAQTNTDKLANPKLIEAEAFYSEFEEKIERLKEVPWIVTYDQFNTLFNTDKKLRPSFETETTPVSEEVKAASPKKIKDITADLKQAINYFKSENNKIGAAKLYIFSKLNMIKNLFTGKNDLTANHHKPYHETLQAHIQCLLTGKDLLSSISKDMQTSPEIQALKQAVSSTEHHLLKLLDSYSYSLEVQCKDIAHEYKQINKNMSKFFNTYDADKQYQTPANRESIHSELTFLKELLSKEIKIVGKPTFLNKIIERVDQQIAVISPIKAQLGGNNMAEQKANTNTNMAQTELEAGSTVAENFSNIIKHTF